MTSQDIPELIERVRAATGPDRLLFSDVAYVLGAIRPTRKDDAFTDRWFVLMAAEAFSDAALALLERCLPGWWVQHFGQLTTGWGIRVERQGLSIPQSNTLLYAPEASLAILLALLTAIQSTHSGQMK